MPIYDTHTRSVVVWPQTEVCSRGVRCGSRVCASNHCARCVRAHGVHVHRMHVLLTDERNHARDSDRENEMPEASLAPWPRAVAVVGGRERTASGLNARLRVYRYQVPNASTLNPPPSTLNPKP